VFSAGLDLEAYRGTTARMIFADTFGTIAPCSATTERDTHIRLCAGPGHLMEAPGGFGFMLLLTGFREPSKRSNLRRGFRGIRPPLPVYVFSRVYGSRGEPVSFHLSTCTTKVYCMKPIKANYPILFCQLWWLHIRLLECLVFRHTYPPLVISDLPVEPASLYRLSFYRSLFASHPEREGVLGTRG
jgi:hypothetical protein